jgi:hypothetical protein
MGSLASLAKYFKGGYAESEKDIRGEVFVPPGNMAALLGFEFHSNVILLGNKGVGKSMFVTVLHEAYLANNELSLLITPGDLECDPILSKKTLSDRKSAAYGQILKAISGLIGKYSNEFEVGISTDVVALQKAAVKEGYSKPDLISRFSNLLSKVTPYGGKLARALLADQGRTLGKNNLTDVVDRYLTARGKTLWLFIDDIDEAVAKNSRGTFDYGACWAIVAAAIELSEDIDALKCVISVRSDIWHLMTRVHGHGTERRDKLGQLHELKFSEEELQKIFDRRVELAAKDAKSDRGHATFFQQTKITLPGETGEHRGWSQWIAKQSRFRPRDLVKLVQLLISAANRAPSDVIGDDHAHGVLEQFGAERIDNIVDEYGQICPQIREVIDDLTVQNTYSFREIIDQLTKMPSRRATQIDGVAMQPNNEHAIALLRILHMACFLNPRIDAADHYAHFNYNDYPNIVSIPQFNNLQKYSWQIHPTFHTYAAEKRKAKRFG